MQPARQGQGRQSAGETSSPGRREAPGGRGDATDAKRLCQKRTQAVQAEETQPSVGLDVHPSIPSAQPHPAAGVLGGCLVEDTYGDVSWLREPSPAETAGEAAAAAQEAKEQEEQEKAQAAQEKEEQKKAQAAEEKEEQGKAQAEAAAQAEEQKKAQAAQAK